MQPRKKLEQKDAEIIKRITENAEATMGEVANNNTGKVFLELRSAYYPKELTDEFLEKEFETCLEQLRALKPENFIKTSDSPKTQAAIRAEMEVELKPLVDFVSTKAKEGLGALDNITTFVSIPNPDAKESKLEKVTYQIPFKQVLPLLWRAYNDSAKFAHGYEGTPESRLAQAEADKPIRLTSFFRCLKRAKAGICHLGIRNELILLVNRAYEGIDIIEDGAAAVEYYLKDEINKAFWKKYKEPGIDAPRKKALMKALFQWISENDASAILKEIDPENSIVKGLKNYFIQHGSDPDSLLIGKLPLQQYIDQALHFVSFTPDSLQPHFHALGMIQAILVDIELQGETDRNDALLFVQNWIPSDFSLESKTDFLKLLNFYSVFNAYKQLLSQQTLLVLSGQLTTDKVKELMAACSDYFKLFKPGADFPAVSRETVEKIKPINTFVSQAQKATMSTEIQNFFILWYEAQETGDRETLKRLYAILREKTVQEKIILTDEIIKAFIQKNTSTEGAVTYLNISPYEVNRIFLHAILVPPSEWSPLFLDTFLGVLEYVKKIPQEGSGIEMSLKRDSYPEPLIEQLNYLRQVKERQTHSESKEVKGEESQERPRKMIVLPEQMRNFDDWLTVSKLLEPKELDAVYDQMSAVLNRIFVAAISDERNDRILAGSHGVRQFEPFHNIPPRFINEKIKLALAILEKNHLSEIKRLLENILNQNIVNQEHVVLFCCLLDIAEKANMLDQFDWEMELNPRRSNNESTRALIRLGMSHPELITPANLKLLSQGHSPGHTVTALVKFHSESKEPMNDDLRHFLENNLFYAVSIVDIYLVLQRLRPKFANAAYLGRLPHFHHCIPIFAEVDPSLINDRNLESLTNDVGGHVASFISTLFIYHKQWITQKNLDILFKLKQDDRLFGLLDLIVNNEKFDRDPEYLFELFLSLGDSFDDRLYKSLVIWTSRWEARDPDESGRGHKGLDARLNCVELFNKANIDFLVAHIEHAEEIARIFRLIIFQGGPSLINDQLRQLVSDSLPRIKLLERELYDLCQIFREDVHPHDREGMKFISTQNFKLLVDNLENADKIVSVMQKACFPGFDKRLFYDFALSTPSRANVAINYVRLFPRPEREKLTLEVLTRISACSLWSASCFKQFRVITLR